MKKIIITVFCIISVMNISLKVHAQSDTEEKALAEKHLEYLKNHNAFEENKNKFKNEFKPYKNDSNHKTNIERIKCNNTQSENGYKVVPNYTILWLTTDNDVWKFPSAVMAYEGMYTSRRALTTYAVIYDIKPDYEYNYDVMGNLQYVQISFNEYKKVYSYNGSLQLVLYTDSNGQTFTYNSNGKYRRQATPMHNADKNYR